MGKVRDKLTEVRFRCGSCGEIWDAEPGRTEDAAEDAWHPWRYFAPCPVCSAEAEQERRQRHLLKMWASATGPKTEEGKAAVTRNLAGHPTPAEAARTRFNAMQHGLRSRVATYFPAKPGKYPQCSGCEYLETICWRQVACLKRTELHMKHQIAFETRDPSLLTEIRATLHANVQVIIDNIVLAIIQDGERLVSPKWYYDKDGGFHLAEYTDSVGEKRLIQEVTAHPLLKTLRELITANNLGLADQAMTPKVQEEQELVRGHLDHQEQSGEKLLEYQKRQAQAMEGLRELIESARTQAARDPVLVEHQKGNPHD